MLQPAVIDPRWFDPDQVSPETAALNEKLEKMMREHPPAHTLEPQVIRDAREQGIGIWGEIQKLPEAETRHIHGPAGSIPIRVVAPQNARGVYMHIHGGGFVLGSAEHQDTLLVAISRRCGVAVVSVDYRLAPENPYPAAPDDCEAAACWLIENSEREFGSACLMIGGESAGANLAAVTLLRMRDRHGYTGFTGANLIYGVFDVGMTPSSRNWGERPLVLTTPLMRWFAEHYVPDRDFDNPDVSPLYAGLANLPPALFTIGTEDPLLDDSLFMHARWLTAGNPAELAVYPGGCHGFNAFPVAIADEAHRRMFEFISGTCLPPPA